MQKLFEEYRVNMSRALDLIDLDSLERITQAIINTLKEDKSIFTMGNGGSGATASHWVCDLNKGIGLVGSKRFRVLCLNDNVPTLMAYANDMSYEDIFIEPLKNYMKGGDLVIAFSGKGNSENVLKAMVYANESGGKTIGFSGFDGGKLVKIAQHNLNVPINDIKIVEDIHQILCHIIIHGVKDLTNG